MKKSRKAKPGLVFPSAVQFTPPRRNTYKEPLVRSGVGGGTGTVQLVRTQPGQRLGVSYICVQTQSPGVLGEYVRIIHGTSALTIASVVEGTMEAEYPEGLMPVIPPDTVVLLDAAVTLRAWSYTVHFIQLDEKSS